MRMFLPIFTIAVHLPIFAMIGKAQEILTVESKMTEEERKVFDQRLTQLAEKRAQEKRGYLKLAKLATEELGKEVMKGNIDFAIDNMYPRFKRIQAKLNGGERELKKRLGIVPQLMRKHGAALKEFKVGKPKDLLYVNGKRNPKLLKLHYPVDYTFQKLVVVPVTKVVQFGVIDKQTGAPTKIEMNSFLIVIYDKNTEKWSFIEGSGISPNGLRNLFPFVGRKFLELLPKNGKVLSK